MDSPKPKRRWFRYSLRTMFVVVTLVCGWLWWQLRIVHQRRGMLKWIEQCGCHTANSYNWQGLGLPNPVPVWRQWMGDTQVDFIMFREDNTPDKEQLERIRRLFSESTIDS